MCVFFLCFSWKKNLFQSLTTTFLPHSPCRNEALFVRPFFPIRSDHRYCGFKNHENEGSGLCGLQRAGCCHKCSAAAAGVPLLQQTHGRKHKLLSACCTGCVFTKQTLKHSCCGDLPFVMSCGASKSAFCLAGLPKVSSLANIGFSCRL